MSRRFFRHGELPLVLLALLSEQPMHGYDVMAELDRLFPTYRPSPGSVYPAMEALEAEGLIEGDAAAGRTTYSVTQAGEEALAGRRDALAALELRTGTRLGTGDSLPPVLDRFRARIVRLDGRVDTGAVEAVLDRVAVEIEALDDESKLKEAQ